MIGVTEHAKGELRRILLANVDNPLAGIRLSSDDRHILGIGLGVGKSDDTIVEHEGAKVLIIEQRLAESLQGISIDVEDTPRGARLVIVHQP